MGLLSLHRHLGPRLRSQTAEDEALAAGLILGVSCIPAVQGAEKGLSFHSDRLRQ